MYHDQLLHVAQIQTQEPLIQMAQQNYTCFSMHSKFIQYDQC